MKKISNVFKVFINIILLISFLVSSLYILDSKNVNHLLAKNSFSLINTHIPGGIKISEDFGLMEYGLFEVGLSYQDVTYTGYSLDKNIFEKTEEVNIRYLEKNIIDDKAVITSYQKGHGLYTRILPFILYQITSIFSKKYIYLKAVYTILSLLAFFRIYYAIQINYSFIRSIIFFITFVLNGYFIMFVRDISAPFFISILPIYLLSFSSIRKKVVNNKNLILIFFILLPSGLQGNTHGPIVWLSFLTGLYLFQNNFKVKENKKVVFLSLLFNIFILLLTEILWWVQRIFYFNQSIGEIKKEIILSFGKYFSSFDTNNLNQCSELDYFDALINFLNLKSLDFIYFEINNLLLFISFFIIVLFFSVTKKQSLFQVIKNNIHIFIIMLITILWFMFIKGAFNCHLHVYPRFLLMSYLPIQFSIKFNQENK